MSWVRQAKELDKEWIKKIYAQCKEEIGSFNLFYSWDNFLIGKGYFVVIPQKGFVRYTWSSKYFAYVVHEIAVGKAFRGLGLGKALLNCVPRPMVLKCNQNNVIGNGFYKKYGMVLAGTTQTKKGVKQNIWTCAE